MGWHFGIENSFEEVISCVKSWGWAGSGFFCAHRLYGARHNVLSLCVSPCSVFMLHAVQLFTAWRLEACRDKQSASLSPTVRLGRWRSLSSRFGFQPLSSQTQWSLSEFRLRFAPSEKLDPPHRSNTEPPNKQEASPGNPTNLSPTDLSETRSFFLQKEDRTVRNDPKIQHLHMSRKRKKATTKAINH